jgi:hypothetical protein
MRRSRPRSDTSNDMNNRAISVSRLTRYLYETRLAFVFAVLAAVVVISAFGTRARAELRCTGDSIATASDRCSSKVAAQNDAADQGIRLVFQSAP